MKSGIYKIENIINGKIYIGSAIYIKSRWACHKHHLRNKSHENSHLQRSWDKYGEESFLFSVLEYCESIKLIEREQFYIDNMCPQYNIAKVAGSSLGTKRTDEQKRKMSVWQKGKKGHSITDDVKKVISLFHKGKKWALGRKQTEEAKKKIANRLITDETRKKISESNRTRIISEEARKNMSAAQKNRKFNRNSKGIFVRVEDDVQ